MARNTPPRPPPISETIPPHVVPGRPRIHVRSLLGLAEFLTGAGIVVSGGSGGGGGGGGGGVELTDTPTIVWNFTIPGQVSADVPTSAVGPFAPTRVAAGDTFTVPVDSQMLIALPIAVEGSLVLRGALVLVRS